MTATKLARVNARLTPEVARKLAYLQRRSGKSVSEVLVESIELHHAAVTEGEGPTLLERAGFVGCGDGPPDLSATYKDALSDSLGEKSAGVGAPSRRATRKRRKA